MKIGYLYLALAAVGLLLPYAQFLPWVAEHGLDVPGMLRELFSTRVGAFFGLDVFVSAVVLLVAVADERRPLRREGVVVSVAATLLVGVSMGLPLFLYFRSRPRDAR